MKALYSLSPRQLRILLGLALFFTSVLAVLFAVALREQSQVAVITLLAVTPPGLGARSTPTASAIPPAATPASQLAAAPGATLTATLPAGLNPAHTQSTANEPPAITPLAPLTFTLSATASLSPTLTLSPTATITVTSSPSLPQGWPGNYPELTASKLSVHVIRNEDRLVMELVRRAHPRLIKALDDFSWLVEVKAVSPGTLTIGRLNDFESSSQEHWPETKDPVAAAEEYVAAHLDIYQRNPVVDYWEAWNEFVPVTPERWKWYALFEATRACLMQAHGLRAAVGGFAAGSPEYSEMALFVPALEAAHRCGGIFTLHEGVSPIIGCGVSATDPEVRIPGAPQFDNIPVGYITVRYRYWYEGYLKPRGLGDLPLVVSELAVGGIVPESPCNGPGGAGWKGYQSWWVQQGVGPTGPEAYVNVLAWYDRLMQKDPYVIGATIFTAGAISPDLGWTDADLHDALIPLMNYLLRER